MNKSWLIFLLIIILPAELYAQDSTWRFAQNQDGIAVYTRKVEGSPFVEYKAAAAVDAPLQKLISLFEDEEQIPAWYYQCVESRLVKNEGPKQKIIYLVLHFPWPVAPRDIVFRRSKSEDPSGGRVSYTLTALPENIPRVKGLVRVPAIRSVWSFKSLTQGRTEIFFQQHVDPGGSIPASLVNALAVDTPYYSLKNLRKLAAGKGG
jgi:hypothetical protein